MFTLTNNIIASVINITFRVTDLPTSKSQVTKAFLCCSCYPPSRLNLVTSWVLYFSPLSVPILLAGIQKQCQCKVSCSGTQYSSYFCKAVTYSESDQARRCFPSLTRLNAHTRRTPLYQKKWLI